MLANSQQSPRASDLIDAITKSNIVTGESVGLPTSESDRLRDTNIVPKSVTTPLEVLPNLSGSEKTRTYNYGLELARAFFDFGLKNKKDTKEKTLIGSQAKAVDMASDKAGPKLDKNKMSFWASVIAATIIIAELIWHYLGPIGVAISKFIIKLPMLFKALGGFKGLIKSLGEIKIFKVIAEFIRPIKRLIDSVKGFLGIGAKAATDVAKGAGALKGFGGLISKVTGTIGKFMMRWLKRLPLIGAIIGVVFAYERFKAGHWVLGIAELLSAVLSLTPVGIPFALIIDGALMIHDLMVSKGYSEAAASSTAAKVGVGAARSLLPLLAKTGTKIGLKIAKVLKFIPFIGGLFNFASAYMRFKEGSWISGILELVAGVASFTGVGTPLAWVIDGGLILYDLLEAKIGGEKAGGDAVKGVKVAVKLLPLLTKFGLKIGTTLLKVIKFIPFVGGLANLAMSYIRFKEGDWFGGILELVAGICAFIPVVQIVSYIIDGGLILYDLLKTKKTEESEVPVGKQQKGVLEKAGDFIGTTLMNVLWYMPGISGLLYFGRGISKIIDGNIIEGIKDIARSVAGSVGGKGLVDLLSCALGFLTETESKTEESEVPVGKQQKGVLEKAGDFIGAKIMNVLWYMPGISGLLYFGRGISKMIDGNIIEGIKDIARSVAGTVGGKGLVDLLSYALGFLTETESNTNDSEIQAKKVSLGDLISKLITGLVSVIGNAIKSFSDWIGNAFSSAIEGAKKGLSSAIEGVKKGLSSAYEGVKKGLSSAYNGVKGGLSSAYNGVKNFFAPSQEAKAELSSAIEGAKKGLSSGYGRVKKGLSSGYGRVKKGLSSGYGRVKGLLGSAYDRVKAAVALPKSAPTTLATEAVKTVNPPTVEAAQPTTLATKAVKTANPPTVEAVQPTTLATEAVKTANPPTVEAVQPISIATEAVKTVNPPTVEAVQPISIATEAVKTVNPPTVEAAQPTTLATEAVKTVNPPVVEAVQPTTLATEAVKTVNPPVVEAVQPISIATEAVKTVNPPTVEAVQPTTLATEAVKTVNPPVTLATPLKSDLQEALEPTIVNKTILTAEVVKQPTVNIVKPPESDFKSADLTEQNDIIMQQNGILLELLNTAKQQLLATRKSSGGSPVTVEGSSTTNATSFDTAFSTSKGDSRSMLFRSPYFLAANPA